MDNKTSQVMPSYPRFGLFLPKRQQQSAIDPCEQLDLMNKLFLPDLEELYGGPGHPVRRHEGLLSYFA